MMLKTLILILLSLFAAVLLCSHHFQHQSETDRNYLKVSQLIGDMAQLTFDAAVNGHHLRALELSIRASQVREVLEAQYGKDYLESIHNVNLHLLAQKQNTQIMNLRNRLMQDHSLGKESVFGNYLGYNASCSPKE